MDLLEILGNLTRRRILALIAERPRYVSELSFELGVGKKAILKHLEILEKSGLVEKHKISVPRGRPRIYYSIRRHYRISVSIEPSRVRIFSSALGENLSLEEAKRLIRKIEEEIAFLQKIRKLLMEKFKNQI